MRTIFKDVKTNKTLIETLKFEYISNALFKRFRLQNKDYYALKHSIEINNFGSIIQEIYLIKKPEIAEYLFSGRKNENCF